MSDDMFTQRVRVTNKTSNVISISPAAVLAGSSSDLITRETRNREYCDSFVFAINRAREDWEWRLRYGF